MHSSQPYKPMAMKGPFRVPLVSPKVRCGFPKAKKPKGSTARQWPSRERNIRTDAHRLCSLLDHEVVAIDLVLAKRRSPMQFPALWQLECARGLVSRCQAVLTLLQMDLRSGLHTQKPKAC